MESQGSISIQIVNKTEIYSNDSIKMDSTTQMTLGKSLTMEAKDMNISRITLNSISTSEGFNGDGKTNGSFIGWNSLNLDSSGQIKADYTFIFSQGDVILSGDITPSSDDFNQCLLDDNSDSHRVANFIYPGQGGEAGSELSLDNITSNLVQFYNKNMTVKEMP